jgi:hypothetical protein
MRAAGEAGESHLHLLAKAVLAERCEITLPPLVIRGAGFSVPIAASRVIACDAFEIETARGRLRPDAVVMLGTQPLAVEFRVTHAVSSDKASAYKALGLSVIEIDLSRCWYPDDADQQVDMILHLAPRQWIYNRVTDGVEVAIARHLHSKGNLDISVAAITELATGQLERHGAF